jgi:hypothetical protein
MPPLVPALELTLNPLPNVASERILIELLPLKCPNTLTLSPNLANLRREQLEVRVPCPSTLNLPLTQAWFVTLT